MQSSLLLTALLMGLAGGPHCVVMCGSACAGIGQAAGSRKNMALFTFQLGRVFGYSMLGGIAAASVQALGWLTVQSAALRPVWSMFHVAAAMLGLVLLWQARQPVWLDEVGRSIWRRARSVGAGSGGAPLVMGTLWAFLPCGLLYSALLVAAMAGGALQGAMVMALFALGTSVTMLAGPWLWLKVRDSKLKGDGAWGVRLAGAALAASSLWALWMALAHNQAPWCV
jgi:sulfite exporter TauE/SafE